MLDDLPFGPAPDYRAAINPKFHSSLKKAMALFAEKRSGALCALYRSEAIISSRCMEDAADVEEVAACCGYFSSCLQYFAEEMSTFLDILQNLQHLQETKPKTWDWLKFWRCSRKEQIALNWEGNRFIFQTPLSTI